jgi:aquaporin TIP
MFFEMIGTSIIAYGVHSHEGKSFLMALFVYIAILFSCSFSGGHCNPAVTFCFYLKQHGGINKSQAIFYLLG